MKNKNKKKEKKHIHLWFPLSGWQNIEGEYQGVWGVNEVCCSICLKIKKL